MRFSTNIIRTYPTCSANARALARVLISTDISPIIVSIGYNYDTHHDVTFRYVNNERAVDFARTRSQALNHPLKDIADWIQRTLKYCRYDDIKQSIDLDIDGLYLYMHEIHPCDVALFSSILLVR